MHQTGRVRRYDYDGQISTFEKTPQGFLKVPGSTVTKTGVFPYLDTRGTLRQELRHPDDVFSQDSLTTLKNAPVTLEHPPSMITPANYKTYSKGYTTDRVEVNNGMVECDIIIADDATISAVENRGLRELSSGYTADIESEQGTYDGTPYQYRQKNIRYNHIAIVRSGRAGPEVRLRMDSADAVQQSEPDNHTPVLEEEDLEADVPSPIPEPAQAQVAGQAAGAGGLPPQLIAELVNNILERYSKMNTQITQVEDSMGNAARKDVDVNQKGISPQISVIQSIPDGRGSTGKTLKAQTPDEKKDADDDDDKDDKKKKPFEKKDADEDDAPAPEGMDNASLQAKLVHMQALIDALQAKVDETKDSSTPPVPEGDTSAPKMDSFNSRVRARVKLEKLGEKILPRSESEKFDSMTDDDIRRAVIQHKLPHQDLRGKSSTYLEIRFDDLAVKYDAGESKRKEMGAAGLCGRMDSMDLNPDAARMRMIKDSYSEWKLPLSTYKK